MSGYYIVILSTSILIFFFTRMLSSNRISTCFTLLLKHSLNSSTLHSNVHVFYTAWMQVKQFRHYFLNYYFAQVAQLEKTHEFEHEMLLKNLMRFDYLPSV